MEESKPLIKQNIQATPVANKGIIPHREREREGVLCVAINYVCSIRVHDLS